MMDPSVSIALIGLFGLVCTVGGPILLMSLQARQRRAEKADDYARQDLVAARVDAAARQAAESAKLVVEATERAAKTAALGQEKTEGQFNQIHTLVNSNFTTQLQATLTASEAQLVSMRSEMKMKGHKAPKEAVAAFVALEKSIVDQKAALAERLRATETAAKEKAERDKLIDQTVGEIDSETKAASDRAADKAGDKMGVAADTMERASNKAELTADKLGRN